jgi:Ino eighty subunit 1
MMENADDEISKTSPAEGSFPQADSGASAGGHHKIIPLKRADGEPLTREDIQYDLLHRIFQDPNAIFRDPYSDVNSPGTTSRVTFCKLYINCILNSPKCTKVARDKMIETPSYAVEFAKLCLLVNVGRINTTLACALNILEIIYTCG